MFIMEVYKLVNPYIVGTLKTEYKTKECIDAAREFWSAITPYLTNNVPKLLISFQRVRDGELFHFKVNEQHGGKSKESKFTIKEVKIEMTSDDKKKFLSELEKSKKKTDNEIQKGGRRRYDDSSSDSSESSDSSSSEDDDSFSVSDSEEYFDFVKFRKLSQPLMYWSYTPAIYKTRTIFTPTFVAPLVPYVKIWIPT